MNDSIVIDCANYTDYDELITTCRDVYDKIVYRLGMAGMFDTDNMLFAARSEIIDYFPHDFPIKLIREKHVGNSAYLLTLASQGKTWISPPWSMSWEDYFKSIIAGEKKSIVILAPWAQAKFININMRKSNGRNQKTLLLSI